MLGGRMSGICSQRPFGGWFGWQEMIVYLITERGPLLKLPLKLNCRYWKLPGIAILKFLKNSLIGWGAHRIAEF